MKWLGTRSANFTKVYSIARKCSGNHAIPTESAGGLNGALSVLRMMSQINAPKDVSLAARSSCYVLCILNHAPQGYHH